MMRRVVTRVLAVHRNASNMVSATSSRLAAAAVAVDQSMIMQPADFTPQRAFLHAQRMAEPGITPADQLIAPAGPKRYGKAAPSHTTPAQAQAGAASSVDASMHEAPADAAVIDELEEKAHMPVYNIFPTPKDGPAATFATDHETAAANVQRMDNLDARDEQEEAPMPASTAATLASGQTASADLLYDGVLSAAAPPHAGTPGAFHPSEPMLKAKHRVTAATMPQQSATSPASMASARKVGVYTDQLSVDERNSAGFTDEKAELRTAAQAPVPPVMDVEPTLEQELHAHAGTYEETGITDPAVFKGQAELGRNMLEELPEDLSVAAGCYEETGITDPATLKR